MDVSGRVTCCCVVLLLSLTSVSAVQQQINSINGLRGLPRRSLSLLHWFANTADIYNNVMELTFNPNGDYGSHHYGNFEDMLDQLPRGYRYYTIGNSHQGSGLRLPDYVRGGNNERIVVRVQNPGGQGSLRIDQVYITQHSGYENTYDPDHTYRIPPHLLREIRGLGSVENLLHNVMPEQFPYQNQGYRLQGYQAEDSENPCFRALKNLCMFLLILLALAIFLGILAAYQPKRQW